MIANVQPSNDIAHSLGYGQNPEKGGEIFLCNLTDETASVQEQIRDWEAMSNPYRNKCYNIVISFSDKDTGKIRQIKDVNKRVAFERMIIKSFLDELSARGNNVYDCPFVVAHHGNTDNEHFHITILNTTKYGKHFRDSFFKKNSCRSAAKISEKFGLEAAEKALKNERNHQKAVGEKKEIENQAKDTKRTYTKVAKDPDKLKYRAERVRLANKRKARCKFIIENIATDKQTDKDNFVEKLSEEGLDLFYDGKFGFFIIMHDEEDENKEYSYLLEKHLGVDMSLLPPVDKVSIAKSWKKYKSTAKDHLSRPTKARENVHVSYSKQHHSVQHTHSSGMPMNRTSSAHGSTGGQTMQGDVNPDGHYNEDDLDEEWKRKSGYHH